MSLFTAARLIFKANINGREQPWSSGGPLNTNQFNGGASIAATRFTLRKSKNHIRVAYTWITERARQIYINGNMNLTAGNKTIWQCYVNGNLKLEKFISTGIFTSTATWNWTGRRPFRPDRISITQAR
jgi:hypothetical protein